VVLTAGSAPLAAPLSEIHLTDQNGQDVVIYLPSLNLSPGEAAYLWISSNGSSYWGNESQAEPDFSVLAAGAPVPWAVRQPGFQIEVFATGFQLPIRDPTGRIPTST
jgi:hypothetical protein